MATPATRTPVLVTKLFIPQPRPGAVRRPHLIGRLNEGLRQNQNQGFARKLTLSSARAGFGKTTLASEWAAGFEQIEPKVPVAWLSLEVANSDPARFLAYLMAAVHTVETDSGEGVLVSLRASRPPPIEVILTALLNEIAAIPADLVLVLDDYHLIDSRQVDQTVAFLVEHLPPHLHLAIPHARIHPAPWRACAVGASWPSCERPICASHRPKRLTSSTGQWGPTSRRKRSPPWKGALKAGLRAFNYRVVSSRSSTSVTSFIPSTSTCAPLSARVRPRAAATPAGEPSLLA